MNSTKKYWETIFSTTLANERSWTQNYPTTSIDYIESLNLPKNAKIIDVGGGDSNLVDALVEKDYENIYILDISEIALQKAKDRLKNNSININWIVSDILEFRPKEKFNFWHDRAVVHPFSLYLSTGKCIITSPKKQLR